MLVDFLPWHVVRADLLARLGQCDAARSTYDAALQLGPEKAERLWLEAQRAASGHHMPSSQR
jgi:RNA polymerase sigma-70 factor (ECF subfamily)